MTTNKWDPTGVYSGLQVSPIINAGGPITRLGGSRTRPEVLDAMSRAARVMVEVNDLNQRAGERVAQLTGAEAGFVCSGAAGGLVLQAAACIAGTDPFKMRQLPDTTGMKNEIIIQNCHRFAYDQAYRTAGAKLVGVGDGRRTQAWELEGAITESTAAVAYLFSNHLSRRAMGLEEVCRIAHKHDVPVVVDGASMLPPRANLTRYLEQGADMVVFSGGKGIRGPQGTGILCGRADLIEAAAAQANPNQFLARPMKVSKEEVVGLVTALELFVEEDEVAEFEGYRQLLQPVVDALVEIPGISVSVEEDDYDYFIPTAVIRFGPEWMGASKEAIVGALVDGDPPIYFGGLSDPDELTVDPTNLTDDEVAVLSQRLRAELTK
jgi:L-seryl-tRNA(Ser) seleniumtransferase